MNDKFIKAINEIKKEIRLAQYNAILNVNKEMILLYWNIGKIIIENSVWGNKFLTNLAHEIKKDFPLAKGFSERNLKCMVKFYREYSDIEFVQTVSAQITWSHNLEILKIQSLDERQWYINKTIENGWSVRILSHQIDTNLYERQKQNVIISNFKKELFTRQSKLVTEIVKDPYIFDFIELEEDAKEKDLEKALIKNMTKVLLEFGKGFAFVGNQYHLNINGDDYYIDLLFYNIKIKCYFVLELKIGDFKPEYVGKLSFYLSAIDEQIKDSHDNPTIGLLLCKQKDNIIAEYTLRGFNKPICISEYIIKNSIPASLKNELPSIDEIIEAIKKRDKS